MPTLFDTFVTASAVFLILSFSPSPSSSLPDPIFALLALRSSLLDPSSYLYDWSVPINQNSSFSTLPWCSWTGISCAGGEVAGIDLSRRNLSGNPFPPELRILSSSLTHLNLSTNSFSGAIPRSSPLFQLRRLISLDLSCNNFNSSLPFRISTLQSLTHLTLYSNSFSGSIPASLAALPHLEHLNLGGSFFIGAIPGKSLSALTKLRFLHLAGNLLTGPIPTELGRLAILEHLEIGYNSYDGGLPPEIGQLQNLEYIDISSANLHGSIPEDIGNLNKLKYLFLFKNLLVGPIPPEISRLASLKILDLSDNSLSGRIPANISLLSNLTILSLMNNALTGEIPPAISDIASLEALLLWNNSLTGVLPPKLGTGGRLERLDVSSNSLSGPIPPDLCFGNRLVRLILFSNKIESEIPPALAHCSPLWRIRIEDNRLSGFIPTGFGQLQNLTYFDLSNNNISGGVPPDLCTASRLQYLNLTGNPLRSTLPITIWMAPMLQIFSASDCKLSGEIPRFSSGCKNLYQLEISQNNLNGTIPADITNCRRLLTLKLNQNLLAGPIPQELAALPFITNVDLSFNFLTGIIPPSFDNSTTLENLNVSFNRLHGPVPSSSEVLRSFHPSSFAGNPSLCGSLVSRLCTLAEAPLPQPGALVGPAVIWIAAAALTGALLILVVGMRWSRAVVRLGQGPWKLTAFQRLTFNADDVVEAVESTAQIIGFGSSGTVYRAEMPDGEVIAIKKLISPVKSRKIECALPEVELLGAVRHRNILRLLGYISDMESTMLLYEYMPSGSLDEILHGSGGGMNKIMLDWETRYRIAVGVAEGMSYLHHDCSPPIVHRDLKPSNILLDEEMEARVADFGLAKPVMGSVSGIVGSWGYIAPEYAYTVRVDERSDVYSYGVVLMELVSGKRAVVGGERSVVECVRNEMGKGGGGLAKLVDVRVGVGCREVREEMVMVLTVAMLCTSERPGDRPSMRDVVTMMRAARVGRKVVEEVPGMVMARSDSDS